MTTNRQKAAETCAKGPQKRRKLREMGFRHSRWLYSRSPESATDRDPQDIGDNGKSLMREWAQMDQEAEDCRRNGAFSYRED